MVGCPDYKRAEGAWGKFHKVDGDDAPCALDTELFEEGSGHDFLAANKGVWVEQGTADDGHENDAEASAEYLGGVADYSAAGHGAKIGDYLSYSDGIGREIVLVLDHEGVEVLGAVGHEIEACHEENEVDEKKPVFFEGDLAFGKESVGNVATGLSHCLSFTVGRSLREAEAEEDDEDRGAGAKPIKRTPAMGGSINQSTREGCCQEVSECIALL